MTRIIGLFLVLAFFCATAEGFDGNQIPNFQDGSWEFEREGALTSLFTGRMIISGGMIVHINDPWGRVRIYRLKTDPLFIGYEDYAYKNREPFMKRWGRETDLIFGVAIRHTTGNWGLQLRDNDGVKLVPEILSGKLVGVGVRFKTPNGSSELYFPDPDYRK